MRAKVLCTLFFVFLKIREIEKFTYNTNTHIANTSSFSSSFSSSKTRARRATNERRFSRDGELVCRRRRLLSEGGGGFFVLFALARLGRRRRSQRSVLDGRFGNGNALVRLAVRFTPRGRLFVDVLIASFWEDHVHAAHFSGRGTKSVENADSGEESDEERGEGDEEFLRAFVEDAGRFRGGLLLLLSIV